MFISPKMRFVVCGLLGFLIGSSLSYVIFKHQSERAALVEVAEKANSPYWQAQKTNLNLVNDKKNGNSVDFQSTTLPSSSTGLEEVLIQGPGFPQYYALYQLANHANVNELRGLIYESMSLQDRFLQFGFVTVFLEKFTYLDPNQAFNFVVEDISKRQSNYFGLVRIVFREWIRLDQDAALIKLQSINDGELKISITMFLLQEDQVVSKSVIDELVKTLPSNYQQQIQRGIDRRLSPHQLFAKAISYQNQRERESALYSAANRWAKEKPIEFLDFLHLKHQQGLISSVELNNLTKTALHTWSGQDFDAAFEYAKLIEQPRGFELVDSLIGGLAQSDPEKAASLAIQIVNPDNRHRNTLATVYSIWANENVKGLLDYIDNNGLQPSEIELMSIATAYVRNYPIEAMNWAADKGNSVIQGVTLGLANTDIKLIEQYYAKIETGPLKQQLVSVLATKKAEENPRQALTWLHVNSVNNSSAQVERAQDNIMYRWIQDDPVDFANYLEAQNKPVNHSVTSSLMGHWIGMDKQTAEQWMSSLPAGQLKDQALAGYARVLISNQASAIEVIAVIDQISNVEHRQSSATSIVYAWLSNNSENADQIIQHYGLDREKIEEFRGLFN